MPFHTVLLAARGRFEWPHSCRMSMRLTMVLGILLTARVYGETRLRAGEYNQVLSIGDAAPGWKNLRGTDDSLHSLDELANCDVVVVAFTCASCPTAVDYEQRIADLTTSPLAKQGKIAVVAVCVNVVPQDKLAKLKERVTQRSLPFHYLCDETQKIAKDYGAIFTPEFYVLNKDRKVVYMGAMDDNTDPAKVTQHFVLDAATAALENRSPAVKETIARGCRVRYVRERGGTGGD